jgi:mannose-6-phosphate isomerase-like protein (cupin superfamily)
MKTQRGAIVLLTSIFITTVCAAEPAFLRRSVADIAEQAIDLSTATAKYKPIFGTGDPNAPNVRVVRFGELTVAPGGSSKTVSDKGTEGVFYVLAGSGTVQCGPDKVPAKQNDFVYLPAGIDYGVSNQSQEPLRLLLMTFKVTEGGETPAPAKLMMASADEVRLQTLPSHGPTTQFKLLMGTTQSKRDKLAVAQQITSLFLMDFAAGGTNIPHRHAKEEEIYYILRGHGDIVAGTDAAKKEMRHASKEGDVYYFTHGTLIGFYSDGREGEDHAQILAVRWPLAAAKPGTASENTDKK